MAPQYRARQTHGRAPYVPTRLKNGDCHRIFRQDRLGRYSSASSPPNGAGDLLHVVGYYPRFLAMLTMSRILHLYGSRRHFGVGESYLYVTHNPVGGAAFEWLYHLCFADQDEKSSLGRSSMLPWKGKLSRTRSALSGWRPLEIEDKRAAFKNLTLAWIAWTFSLPS